MTCCKMSAESLSTVCSLGFLLRWLNIYHWDLLLHLQGQESQYPALRCLLLGYTLWDMWVAYLSCVTDV